MSKAQRKAPQDHKSKAVDRLRAEADNIPGIAETENQEVVIVGRLGEAKVTTLHMLDWDGEVPAQLAGGDYLGAFCGMVSPDDALRIRAVKPTIRALMNALYGTSEETGEASPGESQAS